MHNYNLSVSQQFPITNSRAMPDVGELLKRLTCKLPDWNSQLPPGTAAEVTTKPSGPVL